MKICQHKNCTYPVFGTDKITGIGYCKNHQYCRTDIDRRSAIQKHFDKLKDEPKSESKNDLDRWFDHIIEKVIKPNPTCWNCGETIPESHYRHSVAHICPKSIFTSVSTHPLNFVILGTFCGCHQDSHRLDKFSQMQVWDRAVHRFLAFESEIKEKHKYLDEFKIYAKLNAET